MNRRDFLTAASVAGVATMTDRTTNAQDDARREHYELRAYSFRSPEQLQRFEQHVNDALVPALNRNGARPVGVFRENEPTETARLFLVIPYASLEHFAAMSDRLEQDREYQRAGAEVLALPATDPPFDRIESSLLLAFAGMPRLEVPEQRPRLFELRTYESHSEPAGQKKIEMFNIGEIAIFRRTGLTPVFFGETLIGPRRPNLTYLLVFDDMADHDQSWNTFRTDPEWIKLKSIPEYADARIVSKITRTFLTPTAGSQI